MKTIPSINQDWFIKAANRLIGLYNDSNSKELPYLSEKGVCAGLTATFSYYVTKGKEEKFVQSLREIARLARSRDFDEEELQEAINFIQRVYHLQNFNDFDLLQYNYLKSTGMAWVNLALLKSVNFSAIGDKFYTLTSDPIATYNFVFNGHTVILIRRGQDSIYYDPNMKRVEIFPHGLENKLQDLIKESAKLIGVNFDLNFEKEIKVFYQIPIESDANRWLMKEIISECNFIFKTLPIEVRLNYKLTLKEIEHDYFEGKQPLYQLALLLKSLIVNAMSLDDNIALRIKDKEILKNVNLYLRSYQEMNIPFIPYLENLRNGSFTDYTDPTQVLFFSEPIANGWERTQKILIRNRYYLTNCNEWGQTAFHIMCKTGRIKCLSLLYQEYMQAREEFQTPGELIDINKLDINGNHILHFIADSTI